MLISEKSQCANTKSYPLIERSIVDTTELLVQNNGNNIIHFNNVFNQSGVSFLKTSMI